MYHLCCFMTSCFGNGKVSGNTYVITEVKVESNTLETMKYIAEQDKVLTLTFETNGLLSGTTKILGEWFVVHGNKKVIKF